MNLTPRTNTANSIEELDEQGRQEIETRKWLESQRREPPPPASMTFKIIFGIVCLVIGAWLAWH